MKALLLDPDERNIEYLDIDGSEQTIDSVLAHDELDWVTYLAKSNSRIRVYRNARTVENPNVPGYVIEHTGGAVNHGKCLVVGVNEAGQLTDVPPITLPYVFVPGKGAYASWQESECRGET